MDERTLPSLKKSRRRIFRALAITLLLGIDDDEEPTPSSSADLTIQKSTSEHSYLSNSRPSSRVPMSSVYSKNVWEKRPSTSKQNNTNLSEWPKSHSLPASSDIVWKKQEDETTLSSSFCTSESTNLTGSEMSADTNEKTCLLRVVDGKLKVTRV